MKKPVSRVSDLIRHKLSFVCLFVCLIDSMLYIHGKQLRYVGTISNLTTLFLGKPPGGSLPVLSAILSPVTDN